MLKVGGEVDSFCTRCGMNLAHTIIAMVDGRPVKVECNTCHGVHRFRGALPGGGEARRSSGARPERAPRETVTFDEALRGKRLETTQRYSSGARYQIDDVLEHPSFGVGWVSAVRDATKVEVTFRGGMKVLVHGKR